MKKTTIKLSLVLSMVACLSMIESCKKDAPDPVPTLTFSIPGALSCQIGGANACSNPATSSITGGVITYAISSTTVATISSTTGAITPVSAGTATVTATQASLPGKNATSSASYTLTITAPDPTPVLTFSAGPYTCNLGSTTCAWVATSTVPTGGAISYSVSPTSTATINASTGVVTPVSAGTATVTATQAASTGKNTQATATYSLTITGLSITSFTPTFGGVGYSVTITGTDFDGTTAANNQVTINGVQTATPTNISSTSLTVLVPNGATGAGDIAVKVGTQTATKSTFTEYATVTTLAGDGTQGYKDDTGLKAQFFSPGGLAIDNAGNILVADYGNSRVRSVTVDGVVTTVAGNSSEFHEPWGITVNRTSGKAYVSDRSLGLIKKVDLSSGAVTMFAGSTDGNANGTNLTDVQFDQPHGLAIDGFDNIYVTDRWYSLVREIVSGGYVITLAGNNTSDYINGSGTNSAFYFPDGIVVEPGGNFLLISDYTNNTIRKVTIQGSIDVSTFAGASQADHGNAGTADGTGTAARFDGPSGLAIDDAGNLYVADFNNGLVRKVTPAGVVTTLAGQDPGNGGYLDGLGPFTKIYQPWGITVASDGSAIYVSDGTNRIRKIVP